jgi:hypothetical protein
MRRMDNVIRQAVIHEPEVREPVHQRRQRVRERYAKSNSAVRSVILALVLGVGCAGLLASCQLGQHGCRCILDPANALGRAEEPDLAVLADGELVGVWAAVNGNGQAEILFSSFTDDRNTWATPCRVPPKSGTAVAGRQVGPRLAILPNGNIVVAWVDRQHDAAGDIYVATSKDGGKTFSSPKRVNDDSSRGTGQEYHDIVTTPKGDLAVVWLDERDASNNEANQKQLYLAISRDGGASFSDNKRLTDSPEGVCPCCRPGIVASPDGSLHVIYRDRVGEKLFVRVLSRQANQDHFSTTTLSDGWIFPGCPVNGPAIAAGPDGRIWTLWMEGEAENAHLWWTTSDDNGKTFARKRRFFEKRPESKTDSKVDEGSFGVASHLGLDTFETGEAIAVWENGGGRVWTALLSTETDNPITRPKLIAGDRNRIARSPTLATTGEAIRLCWIEEDILSFVNSGTIDDDTAEKAFFPRHMRLKLTGQVLQVAMKCKLDALSK